MALGGTFLFFIGFQSRLSLLLSKTSKSFTSCALKPQETIAVGKILPENYKKNPGFHTPGISKVLCLAFMTYKGVPSLALHPVLNAFFGTTPAFGAHEYDNMEDL